MSLKRVLNSYLDPIINNVKEPYTLKELKEDYKNKEIGKDWYEGEIEKLNAIWGLIPKQADNIEIPIPGYGTDNDISIGGFSQENIKSGAKTTLNIAGETWSGAREFKPWYQPGENIGALGIRGIEGVGWLGDKLIAKPIASVAHNQLGIHKPVATGIGIAGEMLIGGKGLNKLSKVKLKPKHLGISTKLEKITPLDDALSSSRRMINITNDVEEITSAPSSYLRKVTAIYKNHEGGITWKQAMDMAKRGNSKSVGAASRSTPLQPSSGHGDIERRFPNIKSIKKKLQQLSLEDSYTKGYKLSEGIGTDTPDPFSPSLALEGKKPFFAKGETKRKLSAEYTTGQQVTPKIKEEWVQSGKDTLANYENALGIKFGPKTPGGPIENHHAGIIRQIFEATNGLTQEFRTKSSNYMSHRLGIELGFSKQNAFPVPIRFHPRIHALINKRISRGPGYNLKGIEEKFKLSPTWQTELSYRQRLPIYNEIISTVGDSIKQIDTFWNTLRTRVDLGKGKLLTKEEYMDTILDILELDERLLDAPSPPLMQRKDLGWSRTDTATEIINEILTKAKLEHLTLPIFKTLDKALTKEALSLIIKENGMEALWEVVISGQTPATVFKTYGIKPSNKLIKAIKKDSENWYQYFADQGFDITPQTGKGKTILTPQQQAKKLRKQATAAKTKQTKQVQRKTKSQEEQGQETMTKKLIGDSDYQNFLDKELPDR